jgi:hypothetical protein
VAHFGDSLLGSLKIVGGVGRTIRDKPEMSTGPSLIGEVQAFELCLQNGFL